MVKVLLLNGPPGAGKDEIARQLALALPDQVAHHKFAYAVKTGCHGMFGLLDSEGRVLPHDAFETVKEVPSPDFLGMSPREAYIWYSESVMKPKFGKAVFGEMALAKIQSDFAERQWGFHEDRIVVVSDSGFVEEAKVLQSFFGPRNVCVVHLLRPGCTYEGDSRSYIALPGSPCLEYKNPGNGVDRLRNEILSALHVFLNSKTPATEYPA